ncbi:MAG: hypothetical protein H7Y04_12310 [Verrucomicrobia bacterium]|nr:hypothetical protein [Cytophagales bacterium]
MNYWLSPFEKHVLVTKLSLAEIQTIFYANTEVTKANQYISWDKLHNFEGDFYKEAFEIKVNHDNRNYSPLICGYGLEEKDQTFVFTSVNFELRLKTFLYPYLCVYYFSSLSLLISLIKH